jgi:hypothetical protein
MTVYPHISTGHAHDCVYTCTRPCALGFESMAMHPYKHGSVLSVCATLPDPSRPPPPPVFELQPRTIFSSPLKLFRQDFAKSNYMQIRHPWVSSRGGCKSSRERLYNFALCADIKAKEVIPPPLTLRSDKQTNFISAVPQPRAPRALWNLQSTRAGSQQDIQ